MFLCISNRDNIRRHWCLVCVCCAVHFFTFDFVPITLKKNFFFHLSIVSFEFSFESSNKYNQSFKYNINSLKITITNVYRKMAMSSLAIRSLNLTKAAAGKSGALKTVCNISCVSFDSTCFLLTGLIIISLPNVMFQSVVM